MRTFGAAAAHGVPRLARSLDILLMMKILPLLLLALMAALFAATLGRPETWAGWVNAFAEAGMVGALADWFAVVALFRYPLGLPIPHTAIIPRRKDEIGDSLARFVAEHFLHPEVVGRRLAAVNLAANAADWLNSPTGRARAADLLARIGRALFGLFGDEEVRVFSGRLAARQLERVEPAPLLGKTIEWLIEDGRHQAVLTQALRIALVTLNDNRDRIRGAVQRGSPWWMPGFVDDRIVVQMLDRIETMLLELSLDPGHPLRGDFDRWAQARAAELQYAGEYRAWGERLKTDLADNAALRDYLAGLLSDFASGVRADLDDPASPLRAELERLVGGFGAELARDPDMQLWVDGWLQEAAVALVAEHRDAIASLISETVRSWDAREMSQRVEAAIGTDLQYIRINGTLVGGLVGILIHAVKVL
jgi:uncharacterized membrane-anchored protein YjiN (DUF445 family)